VEQLERELAEQKWMAEAIGAMAFSTVDTTGQEFLQVLLRHLSTILNVRCVFVTEWVPGRTDRLRTVAGWCGERAAEPLEYHLADTPCQEVLHDGQVFFPSGVQQRFPLDKYLATFDIESYMGVSLIDRAGRTTGHLCIMDVRQFRFDESQGNAILRVFAARVAAEVERLRVETALREREERFRMLYDDNPSMYFTLSPEGTILSVNAFGATQLGYQEDELIGRSVLAVFNPDDHQTVLARLKQCASKPRQTFEWEIPKVRKDGTRLWVHERARAIADHADAITILVVCEDVTERRKATRLLSTLVRSSPLPIISLDPEGRVMSWNLAATELFGWTEEEVLGCELPYVQSGEEAGADALWQAGIRGEVAGPVELRRRRKDGALLDLLLWPVFVYDVPGQLSTAVGIYVDQSDLKRAESTLAESEQAIRDLQTATSDPNLTLDERIHRVLEIGCRRFNLPIGVVTKLACEELHLTHVRSTVPTFHIGMRIPLCHTYWSTTLLAEGPICIEHAGASEWRHHPGYQAFGLESYIGTKLAIGTHVHGTVCFLGHAPRSTRFTPAEKDFLLLMACWISEELDRRESELALRRSEAKFRTLVETTRDWVWEVNEHAVYTYASPRIRDILGYEPNEVIGRTPFDLMPPEEARRVSDLFSSIAATRQPFTLLENTNRHKTGRLVVLETSGTPIFDSDGTFRGYHGVDRDITERKLAEEALRHSEARLHRFVANAPVGLVILGEDRRIISANKALCALTGYSDEEILGNTYELYTHPEDLPANLILTDEFYRGVRSEYTYEKRYIRKSGEIIWVSVRASRVELPGHREPLLLAAVQDITERKLATEEREQLSRDLHDNILQSLYAVGMQVEAGKLALGQSPRRSKTHMTCAINQLQHLMTEVRQFIALLMQRTSPKPDLGQALQLLVASLSGAGQSSPELQIQDHALTQITPERGEQLLNIAREALSNSMRHARATHRSVRLSRTKRALRLVIRDDGVGFSTKQQPLRGHGLANMVARAEKIHARLTLDSAPGKGTCVSVEVPVERGATHA
jgi:PAS domain S-box-containing protein